MILSYLEPHDYVQTNMNNFLKPYNYVWIVIIRQGYLTHTTVCKLTQKQKYLQNRI